MTRDLNDSKFEEELERIEIGRLVPSPSMGDLKACRRRIEWYPIMWPSVLADTTAPAAARITREKGHDKREGREVYENKQTNKNNKQKQKQNRYMRRYVLSIFVSDFSDVIHGTGSIP